MYNRGISIPRLPGTSKIVLILIKIVYNYNDKTLINSLNSLIKSIIFII